MKKVLVVITTGFVTYGGLTTVFMNYFRAMDKDGLRLDVASIGQADKVLADEIEREGGHYYNLPSKQKKIIAYMFELWRICKGYDVIHVHGNSPLMAVELAIAKSRGVQQRIAHSHNTSGMHPILNTMCRCLFNNLYTIGLACSQKAGEWLYTKEFHVLNNAICTEKYAFSEEYRRDIRSLYKINSDFVIGNVSKFVDAKNHEFIINLFSKFHEKHNDCVLLLVGDGPNRERIERLVHQRNIEESVIITGLKEETSKFYSAIDLFVLPSFHEGLCLALLEAQASGLPCLVSTNVTTENGICDNVWYWKLIEELWIEQIEKKYIARNSVDRLKMSNASCRKLALNGFDIKTVANQLRNYYME